MNNAIPVVSLKDCVYKRDSKVITMSITKLPKEERVSKYPAVVMLESHATGKRVLFSRIIPGDILYDEDQWDGVQQVYRAASVPLERVNYLIIHEQDY